MSTIETCFATIDLGSILKCCSGYLDVNQVVFIIFVSDFFLCIKKTSISCMNFLATCEIVIIVFSLLFFIYFLLLNSLHISGLRY